MKPAPFHYVRPTSRDEVFALLAEHGEDAKVLAGGQSLVPLMNFRLARPAYLVDLNRVPGLSYLQQADGMLRIGAMTRHREVERAAMVAESSPLVRDAAAYIGHEAIRNWGTFGGSVAHADPSAEWPLVAITMEAECVLARAGGERVLAAADFFVDTLTTALDPDELLTEVRLPVPGPDTGWSFQEFSRRHGDFAVAAVAVLLHLDPARAIDSVRIGFGGVDATPRRAQAAEEMLVGQTPGDKLFEEAATLAVRDLDPPSDVHGSSDYRRRVARQLCQRALAEATARSERERP